MHFVRRVQSLARQRGSGRRSGSTQPRLAGGVINVSRDQWSNGQFLSPSRDAISASSLSGKVVLSREERGLVVTLLVDDLIFPPQLATLQPEGEKILSTLLPALTANGNRLIIEGHTNTAPVRPIYFPSEWELSSARAGAVARYLNDQGIPRERMHIAGYGDTAPLVPETNPNHLRLNRRVAIVVASNLTDEERGLLSGARAGQALAGSEAAQ